MAKSINRKIIVTAILATTLLILPNYITLADSPLQTKSSQTQANDDSNGGTQSWSNLLRVETSNNSYATASLSDNEISKYLKVTNFGFSIPSSVVIKGVVVDVERKVNHDESEGYSPVQDASVRLAKGGIIGSTDRSTLIKYTKTDIYESHGGQNDLWGETLTPDDINASNFGIAFASKKYGTDGGNVTVSLDHIQITVYYNNPPVAADSNEALDEDMPRSVILNASDADGDPLIYSIVTIPFHGTLGEISDNQITYTPNPNFNGFDSFTFKANDGAADSNTAIISITVNAVNDAPIAQDQSASTDEDTPVVITLPATDVEGDLLVYSVVSEPGNGNLGEISNNQVSYTPNENFNGTDTFTFKANDGQADSNIATVNVLANSINDSPVASGLEVFVDEDTPLLISFVASDTESDPLTYSIVSGPAQGSLGEISDNQITYTPNPNFNGSDSLTFKANDGVADSNTAIISITVNVVNDAPVLASIGNKSVIKSGTLQFTAVATDPESLPENLTFSIIDALIGASINAATGVFVWTPNENMAAGDYNLTIQVSDGDLNDSETIIVTVIAPAAPIPAAGNASAAASGTSGYSQSFATPTEGGEVVLPRSGSEIQLTVPQGAVSSNVIFSITAAPYESYIEPGPSGELTKVSNLIFEINAADNTTPVTSFLQPLTININYQDSDVAETDENSLAIYWWDKILNQWIALPSQIDAVNNIASATVDHLTVFGLMFRKELPVVIIPVVEPVVEKVKPEEPSFVPLSGTTEGKEKVEKAEQTTANPETTLVNQSGFLAATGVFIKKIFDYFRSIFH